MSNTLAVTKKTKDSLRLATCGRLSSHPEHGAHADDGEPLENSAEHQAFVRKLAEIKRPVGVVLVIRRTDPSPSGNP